MCRGRAGKPYATGIKPCAAARAEAVATGTEAAALASSQSHTLHGASLVQDLGLRGVFSTNHFPFSFFSLLFLLIQSLESITRKNEMATRQPHHAWHPAGHTSAPNPGTRASPCHLPQPHVLSPKHPPLPLFCKFFLFLAFFFSSHFTKTNRWTRALGYFSAEARNHKREAPCRGTTLQRVVSIPPKNADVEVSLQPAPPQRRSGAGVRNHRAYQPLA